MKNNFVKLIIFAAVVMGCLLGILFVITLREEVTTSMPSPDGRTRAVLIDRPHQLVMIDRNFKVRIERPDGKVQTIYRSPDESPSGIGLERFLWSKDGTRLLLIGKRFWVKDGVKLKSGEFLYLLYDLQSEKIWCNSDSEYNNLESFGMAELSGYDFGEVLSLAERESNDQP